MKQKPSVYSLARLVVDSSNRRRCYLKLKETVVQGSSAVVGISCFSLLLSVMSPVGLSQETPNDLLTSKMRTAILTTRSAQSVSHPDVPHIQRISVFSFESFIEEHGLDTARKALVPLLSDPDKSVRELTQNAAQTWLRPADIGSDRLHRMLHSSDTDVRQNALQFAVPGLVKAESVLSATHDPQETVRLQAVDTLQRYAHLAGVRDSFRKLLHSSDVETAAAAIQVVGQMGVSGRFAENALCGALQDQRHHSVAISLHLIGSQPIALPAIESLRQIRFRRAESAAALRRLTETRVETDAHPTDFRYQIRLQAALTLAICAGDFEPVRQELRQQIMRCEKRLSSNEHDDSGLVFDIPAAIDQLLLHRPAAILDWTQGESICRRCIGNRKWRESNFNWDAIRHYPDAVTVFRTEFFAALREQRLDYADDDYFYSDVDDVLANVISQLASDGLTVEETVEILITIGKRSPPIGDSVARSVRKSVASSSGNGIDEHGLQALMLDLIRQHQDYVTNFEILVEQLAESGRDYSKLRAAMNQDRP